MTQEPNQTSASEPPGEHPEPVRIKSGAKPFPWSKAGIWLAAFGLMFTFLTFPPAPQPSQGAYEADASLSAVLTYAHQHGLQFGKDLAYTYGPLGFLVFFYCGPATARFHMSADIVLCFTAALGLCLVAARLTWLWRCLLVAGFAWGAANIYPRGDLVLNVGLLCWGLLCTVTSGRELTAACAVVSLWAAFCALAKVSYIFVATGFVLPLAALVWLRGRPRLATGMVLGVIGSFVLGWILAGQELTNIGNYLAAAVAMAKGYNAALGWEELPWARTGGIAIGLVLLGLLSLRLRWAFEGQKPAAFLRAAFAGWLCFLTFTVYKHGFVRGFVEDLNPTFLFASVLAPALAFFSNGGKTLRRLVGGLTLVCWVLPLLALQVISFPGIVEAGATPFRRFAENLHWAFKPGDYLQSSTEAFNSICAGAKLPKLGSLAGNARVDVFGRRQLYATANELNYTPRPVPQSYAACNTQLMQLNEEFYLSRRAPEYVLFQLDTFDRKFPPLEDALVLRDLLINYEPIGNEDKFLLLKARAVEKPSLKLLQEGSVHAGEPIDLRKYGETPLWLEVTLEPSWTGWLRALLYRPPVVRLAVWREANKTLLVRRRAPASMLQAGFLASPLVLNNDDVSGLYTTNFPTRPAAYSVETALGGESYWREPFRFKVYEVENQLGRRTGAAAGATGGAAPANDNATHKIAMQPTPRPLTLFHNRAWRSGPAPGNSGEVLSYLIFVLIPCGSSALLLVFIRDMRRHRRPATPGRLITGNVLLLAFLLSATFLAGETYFRFFYDTTDSLGYTKVCQRWVQRHWQTNQAGCRDNVEYATALQPGRRRITFIGDSFTAGHGIKDVEERFANRLRRAHPDWDIQALANVGLDTGGEQILLNRALRQGYQLDEVVLVYCLNDVGELMPEQVQAYDQLFAQQGGWLARNSYLVNLLYNRYRAAQVPLLKNYFPFVADAYRGPLWEKQKARLKEFRDTVLAHGGHLAVMTFPFLDVLGTNYPYEFVHQELANFWRDQQVPELDLLPVYSGLLPRQLTVNRFDAHPNELANKLAAQALENFLPGLLKSQNSLVHGAGGP